MQTRTSNLRRAGNGFTLIELLVVIAIIAILAGMILAGIMTVKSRAMTSKAKVEVVAIAAAIADYTAAYGMPPVTQKVWNCSKDKQAANENADFTYGDANGSAATIKSYGNPNYVINNAEIIAVLRNFAQTNSLKSVVDALNPKKVTYLDAPVANNSILPGVGPDGVFRDPWGNPYIISVDLDMDGKTADGYYGSVYKRAKSPIDISSSALVWSFGPDGKVDTTGTATPTGGANKDNVVSWDK